MNIGQITNFSAFWIVVMHSVKRIISYLVRHHGPLRVGGVTQTTSKNHRCHRSGFTNWSRHWRAQKPSRYLRCSAELRLRVLTALLWPWMCKQCKTAAMESIKKDNIPQSYVRLKEMLIRQSTHSHGNQFSVTAADYYAMAQSEQIGLDYKSAELAKRLFCIWYIRYKRSLRIIFSLLWYIRGDLYELSSGDIVLQPQRLADVLARVFTARKLDSMLQDGILRHDNNSLREVIIYCKETSLVIIQ